MFYNASRSSSETPRPTRSRSMASVCRSPGGQVLSMGTNGGALTLGKMDELVDTVVPGKPDLLLMSTRSRRKLKDAQRTSLSASPLWLILCPSMHSYSGDL
jgi:hypothetical protein